MDRKIRIHFFPRDASRVRSLVFSRRLALAGLAAALPLCLLGFWLVLSGGLREDARRNAERRKLENEARVLGEKTEALKNETRALSRNLDSLESVRIRVMMASGLEAQRAEAPDGARSRPFRLFGTRARRPEDFTRALERARKASHFMDSSLFILRSKSDLAARLPTIYPVGASAIVTRTYGPAPDPFTGRRNLHPGVDFSLPPGSPVRAAGGGTVSAAGNDPLWGWYVRIRHSDRVETFYAHLQDINVSTSSSVDRGEVVGWVGSSGATTGPHLHFEMRLWGDRVDPLLYLNPGDAGRRAAL